MIWFGAGVTHIVDTVLGCEGTIVTLTCRRGYSIRVLTAFWGRNNSYLCPREADTSQTSRRYSQPGAMALLTALCEGLHRCPVEAEVAVFGDPRHLPTPLYLYAQFICLRKYSLLPAFKCHEREGVGGVQLSWAAGGGL